jgi:DNA-binding transcriptional LysR family regulator
MMDMLDRLTLDQLRVLVAVTETGSFSGAARRLGRVQSAVSQTIQSLESTLGMPLFDRSAKVPALNEAGKVILRDARHLLHGVDTLKARAESIASEVEPDLSIAVDVMFPNEVLIESLRGLREHFPLLPVNVYTEGLGAAEERLTTGAARIAIYVPFNVSAEFEAEFLVDVPMVPVASPTHPLGGMEGPIGREELEQHTQLVLTDRSNVWKGITGGVVSPLIWRFADQTTRLEFLLAGMGWCNMPYHTVARLIAAERLKALDLAEQTRKTLPLHVVHKRGAEPGRAGRWLIEDLRRKVRSCVSAGAMGRGAAHPLAGA